MDIRDWAMAVGATFVFKGEFDPQKNSGYINVELHTRGDGERNRISVEGGPKSYGRSGERPVDNYEPKIPYNEVDDAILDLAETFSEQTLTNGAGFTVDAPDLTYDKRMLARPTATRQISSKCNHDDLDPRDF